MKKTIVVYMTENDDLYHEVFDDDEQAEALIGPGGRAEDNKAIVFTIESPAPCDFTVRVDDRT